MECHHQGFVAVAHIDKWDHATRTDPEFWKFGTLERMRERPPPKKAATKEQVEHPPWSQKNQGGSCSQIRRIFRHQGLVRHSQCQLRWNDLYCLPCSCNMKKVDTDWVDASPSIPDKNQHAQSWDAPMTASMGTWRWWHGEQADTSGI